MSSALRHDVVTSTVSTENYLKAIYHAQGESSERVKTKELAERLGISLPSVTGMLKSLAEDGLVEYQPYRGVRLTQRGRRAALRVIRHHRLIEAFLVEVLDYSWDEVHAEAEILEHAVSDKLAERIDRYLGHPTHDPHGDPIPTSEGKVRRGEGLTLSESEIGEVARVVRVLDQAPEILRYLDSMGLSLGASVKVLEVMPFDGPVRLACNGHERTISRALASRVIVAAG